MKDKKANNLMKLVQVLSRIDGSQEKIESNAYSMCGDGEKIDY